MSKRNRTNLSKILRELRLKNEMTLEEAAAGIGCHKAFLSGVESGRYPFPLKRLKAADELFRPHKTKISTSSLYAALLADIAAGESEIK